MMYLCSAAYSRAEMVYRRALRRTGSEAALDEEDDEAGAGAERAREGSLDDVAVAIVGPGVEETAVGRRGTNITVDYYDDRNTRSRARLLGRSGSTSRRKGRYRELTTSMSQVHELQWRGASGELRTASKQATLRARWRRIDESWLRGEETAIRGRRFARKRSDWATLGRGCAGCVSRPGIEMSRN